MDHVDSYYAATANPVPPRPTLQGDIDADVCVVGGGIAGCSTALHLAERGYRVVLLEGHNGRLHRLPMRLITRGRLEVEFRDGPEGPPLRSTRRKRSVRKVGPSGPATKKIAT